MNWHFIFRQFHINDHSKNYGVYESKPKPDPVFKKADAGAFTPAPNPMDPKVSGVFENVTEEGSTQEKWGAQLQVALLLFVKKLLIYDNRLAWSYKIISQQRTKVR